jgi:DNA-binding HxlR family transcriptional regulator
MAVTRTSGTSGAGNPVARPPLTDCRARDVLNRVGDKWSVFVIDRLGQGSQRFNELRRTIDGITGRMLTVTLRGLERDGLVARTVHPVIPPRVDYALTPMGATLLETIEQLVDWADSHTEDIYAARSNYDARHTPDEPCTADEPFTTDETPCPGDEAACDG